MNFTAEKLTLEIVNNCNHHSEFTDKTTVNVSDKVDQKSADLSCRKGSFDSKKLLEKF